MVPADLPSSSYSRVSADARPPPRAASAVAPASVRRRRNVARYCGSGKELRLWAGKDSNLRTLTRADLQSAAFDRSATYPINCSRGSLVKRACKYKLPSPRDKRKSFRQQNFTIPSPIPISPLPPSHAHLLTPFRHPPSTARRPPPMSRRDMPPRSFRRATKIETGGSLGKREAARIPCCHTCSCPPPAPRTNPRGSAR